LRMAKIVNKIEESVIMPNKNSNVAFWWLHRFKTFTQEFERRFLTTFSFKGVDSRMKTSLLIIWTTFTQVIALKKV
jgi:hypothetical protein